MPFGRQVVIASAIVGAMVFAAAPKLRGAWKVLTLPPAERFEVERATFYPNCAAARAAGVAPIYSGSPGYRSQLDADGDGIACEPYR